MAEANNPPDEEVDGLMSQIAPCIWDVNAMSKRIIPLIAIGVDDLAIVATSDGILVTAKKSSDKLKDFVLDR